jgi:hypothetical protein
MQPPLQFWQDPDGRVWVTRIGCGWIAVPGEAWAAFAARVKRGDYDQT